jgi:outer membrane biosynthesis protein TonB
LAAAFHATVLSAFLWASPDKSPAPMPDDIVQVTIERLAAPVAVAAPPMPFLDLPGDDDLVRPAETPTLEKAVANSEPAPSPTGRDFAKLAVPDVRRSKPASKPETNPDLDKAFEPPPGWMPPAAALPAPLPNQGETVQRNKAADDYLAKVARTISEYRRYDNRDYAGYLFAMLVIARNGNLVRAAVLVPSERTSLDAQVMETIHLAAPYAPLPDRIEGEHATFFLPVQYVPRILR